MTNHVKYRPDIDGLRAFAVLSVIFFHAFPMWLTGGFAGVDVFFVISGYLISSIIMREMQAGEFSIKNFYIRRVRRIFPALIFVLVACLAAGLLILFPSEQQSLGKHVFGGAAFVANFMLWSETGYFETAAELKPLLHLWSLGIEEQFYLLWPLLLMLGWRWRQSRFGMLGLVMALSFLTNLVLVESQQMDAAFYAPISRFWELLAGAWLARRELLHGRAELTPGMVNLLAGTGLLLLAGSVFWLNRGMSFPGWRAVLPVLGTVLLLAAGPTSWLSRHLLASRVAIFFGLISYPLYLWHWPVLTFARIVEAETLDRGSRIVAVLVSILLAWLTYRLLERPLRAVREGVPVVRALLAGMMLVAMLGGLMALGVIGRSNSEDARMAADLEYLVNSHSLASCPPVLRVHDLDPLYCRASGPTPATVILGDSHADHLYYGLADALGKHSLLLLGNNGCPPLLGVEVTGWRDDCQRNSAGLIDYLIATPSIQRVILSFYGGYVLDSDYAADHRKTGLGPSSLRLSSHEVASKDRTELFRYGLERTVAKLQAAGKQVIILIDVPELPFFPRDCLTRPFHAQSLSSCSLSVAEVMQRQQRMRVMLAGVQAAYPDVRLYDPLPLLCPQGTCQIRRDGILFYRDSHHLSLRGAAVQGRVLARWLNEGEMKR